MRLIVGIALAGYILITMGIATKMYMEVQTKQAKRVALIECMTDTECEAVCLTDVECDAIRN